MKIWLMAGVSALAATSAYAQQTPAQGAPPAPIEDGQGSEERTDRVVVTGSLTISDGSEAPTPVTVVSSEQLTSSQPGLIGEALNVLPSFRGSTRPTTGFTSATGPGTGSFLNLRNLGPQRTLVLVDGRRATPSSRDGAVDVNTIPSELVSRVDVVTGGASAAYGSDAVAGVVNFILDTDFTGLKAAVQGGVSGQGDGQSYKVNLTGGSGFDGDRGHFVASGGYYKSEGIASLDERDWASKYYGYLSNPAVPGQLIIRPDARSATASDGGLILSGPLAYQQFLPGGTLGAFNRGSVQSGVVQFGGDGSRLTSNISADIETASLFGHVDYELAPNLEVFGQANFAKTESAYNQVQQFNIGGFNHFTIYSGNAFLNPGVQSTLTSTNTPAFLMGRINKDFGRPSNADAQNEVIDATAGFVWDAPADWTVNGYYEHGNTKTDIQTHNNVNLRRLYAAADAVRDSSNQIVCNVTITNPGLYPGCVPINLFGSGAPSAEAIAYVEGTSAYRMNLTQDVASITANGELFSNWAGPVSAAFGADYRKEKVEQTSDDVTTSVNNPTGIRGVPAVYANQRGGWLLTNVFPVAGSYDLWEAYGEVAVPLARDLPLMTALDFNGAVRYTDYSTSGGVTTWKAGLVWQPVDGFRVRATQSRDIRAPNVPELFAGFSQATGSVVENGTTVGIIVATSGNAALQPEEADTFTAGVVFEPSAIPGLTASIDYYSIDISGVISALSAQVTRDQCAAGATSLCANITRSSSGTITRIVSPTLNLNQAKTSGVDFEVDYKPDWDVFGGQTNFRLVGSYLDTASTSVFGGTTIDRAGETGQSANPDWSATASATWSNGPLSLFVQERYIAAGILDATRREPTTIEDNSVDAAFYTDLTASYDLDERAKLTLTINNLFDKAPPLAPIGTLSVFAPTNPYLFDQIGRYYTLRLNYQF